MKLILEAAINDKRLSISFSHKETAENWYKHVWRLQNELRQAFPPEHSWKITFDEGSKVSMNLPDCIEIGRRTTFDVELRIPNDHQADRWDNLMILWNRKSKDISFNLNRFPIQEQLEKDMHIEGFPRNECCRPSNSFGRNITMDLLTRTVSVVESQRKPRNVLSKISGSLHVNFWSTVTRHQYHN